MVENPEFKVIGFFCNWCSYAGADLAGNMRLNYPADVRILRIPCTGRMDPLFALKALLEGADGVMVSGCHPGDCHYREGNYYARRRLALFKEILPALGIESERFKFTWISASEGKEVKEAVEAFIDGLQKLGKFDPSVFSALDPGIVEEIKEAKEKVEA